MSEISFARDFLLPCISNDTLYVAGGYNAESEATNAVEKYDHMLDEWRQTMPTVKSVAGGVIFEN